MSKIDLTKNKKEIVQAWRDVVDDKTGTNWAIFGYEALTDVLTVVSKGYDGIDEMKDELNSGKIMYAFCKVFDPKTNLNKYVLVNWQGEGSPLLRKGVCANHIRDVSNILKGAHVTLNARTEEDVDSDIIVSKVSKSTASSYSFEERLDLSKDGFQKMDSAYKKVVPKNEINAVERDKFWAREEEQEKQRQSDETRKKNDESLRLEEERLRRETEDARKRELLPDPTPTINNSKKNIEPYVSINSKIEQIEKTKDAFDFTNEKRNKEAQELISQRTVDVRAVFEQHTSAGQLKTSRKSSIQFSEPVKTNGSSPTHVNINGEAESIENAQQNTVQEYREKVVNPHIIADEPVPEIKRDQRPNEESFKEIGLRAVALYDYEAADETEISFDPDDIITQVEQIDPGWWQGLGPDGNYGLFPANYVQLLQ